MGGFLPPAERRSSFLLGTYAALSLILLVVGDRIPTASLRGAGALVFAPLDRVVLGADRMAAAWRENQRLHQRIAQLEVDNQRLRSAGYENEQFRRQLGLPGWNSQTMRPVEILALAGDPLPTAALVSAGRRQGVANGSVVVTEDGLLGRITEVYGGHSRVSMITDPGSAVACEVESTGVLGILHVQSAPRARIALTGVPLTDTVSLGQRVLTSGFSKNYPRGIRVGTVIMVGHDASGLTQEIVVEPAARLSRLRHGFVLAHTRELEGTP